MERPYSVPSLCQSVKILWSRLAQWPTTACTQILVLGLYRLHLRAERPWQGNPPQLACGFLQVLCVTLAAQSQFRAPGSPLPDL